MTAGNLLESYKMSPFEDLRLQARCQARSQARLTKRLLVNMQFYPHLGITIFFGHMSGRSVSRDIPDMHISCV